MLDWDVPGLTSFLKYQILNFRMLCQHGFPHVLENLLVHHPGRDGVTVLKRLTEVADLDHP